MSKPKVLVIFGTRPEAIKLCPVVQHFSECRPELNVRVCVTAQHRDMLDQVLGVFGVTPHHDLNAMRPGQTLSGATSAMLAQLEPVFQAEKPSLVIVQGDTTTTLCGALAGFYSGVPVAHVEAGLRTGDMKQPFPEEMNRVVVGRLTDLHFAATESSAANLRAEGVDPERIWVTGNTGIDAVLRMRDAIASGAVQARDWSGLDASRRLIVVTAHRRESFGEGFVRICEALRQIADTDGVQMVYPVHPNPHVTATVRRMLGSHPNIVLVEPLDYSAFISLAMRAHFIVTDSGGIQEEAPSLGKPVLVLREKTERPEAVQAGTATLVGTDPDRIVGEATWLLKDSAEYERRRRIHNPYGDGQASRQIGEVVSQFLASRA